MNKKKNILKEYQEFCAKMDKYGNGPLLSRIIPLTLGITEEAGEIAGKLKKHFRGDYDFPDYVPKAVDELGDLLWYLTRLANTLGETLESIMIRNMEKLEDRSNRNKIHGDGDAR